jgi:hypothetical protein
VAEGPVKFGNLLVKLDLISESDLQEALRLAPQYGLPLGKTLVVLGRLRDAELQIAVELQPLINQQNYPMELAKKIAELVHSGLSPSAALKQLSSQLTPAKPAPAKPTTIGQLFLDANVLNETQLEDAQRASYQTGMRLGRVLVMKGFIDAKELDKGLQLQTRVRNGGLSRAEAVETLRSNHPEDATSRKRKSTAPAMPQKKMRFTEFFVSSGMATDAEMMNALETSFNEKLSLGDAIVKIGLVSQRVLDNAFELYNKVSAGELAYNDAANRLHRAVFGDPEHGHIGTAPVLGELLKMTNIVTDHDIEEAIALASKYPSVIGKMLVLSGAIDEATLIATLRCQFLLKNGYLKLDDGLRALKHSKEHKMSFDDSLEELGLREHHEATKTKS